MSGLKLKETDKYTKDVLNEIDKLRKTVGLTAKNLVGIAESKGSKLHDMFEWDNTVAAKRYRIYQARLIINTIEVTFNGDDVMPAYERVTIETESIEPARVYERVDYIMESKKLKEQVANRALRELITWKEKYLVYGDKFNLVFKSIIKTQKSWVKK